MIRRSRRWRFLGAAPADQRLFVEAEAQHDLARAMREEIEALRLENEHLRAEAAKVPHLKVLLSRAQLGEWMWWGVARRNAAQRLEATKVISRRDLSAPTEYVPRRYR